MCFISVGGYLPRMHNVVDTVDLAVYFPSSYMYDMNSSF